MCVYTYPCTYVRVVHRHAYHSGVYVYMEETSMHNNNRIHRAYALFFSVYYGVYLVMVRPMVLASVKDTVLANGHGTVTEYSGDILARGFVGMWTIFMAVACCALAIITADTIRKHYNSPDNKARRGAKAYLHTHGRYSL